MGLVFGGVWGSPSLSARSTVWVAPKTQGEAPDLSLDAHLSDSSSSAPLALEDADGHAGHATPKKKRAYGCTGMNLGR